MSLACQKNSYLKQLTTKVISCEAASEQLNGSKTDGFNIILNDTVLFPEGGGQPDDRGTINGIPVLKVSLKDNQAVHFTLTPLSPGDEADVRVDWVRRFDHMQQHSAQHLITAVAEANYNFKTTAWSLSETACKIELDTPSLSVEQQANIEDLSNQYVREQLAMYPTYYDDTDHPAVQKIKSRGLPDNLTGPIRVMTIDGIDENLCCGTHVSNTSHLQSIKLIGTEKGKKGCTLLSFHAGRRVLRALEKSLNTEREINSLMTGSPDDFPDLIKKLQNAYKVANKNSTSLLKELVAYEAQRLSDMVNDGKCAYIFHHRREGDNTYMNELMKKLSCPTDVIKFISVGDERGSGSFLLCGPEQAVGELSPKLLIALDAKGSGKSGRFMGKANKLSRKHKVEELINDYLASS
ncbi:alanyl-tRNA editing protein Aarsd1-like [Watersipora subatra]|uniref:alanyl-tRNA editing protein Aarsd1-like n=1 Tax=Watersipora subatra TaxID=2589382 RepID=UPI00355AF6EB